MASVFSTKSSVFFVGGTGTKAGNANAGGCTKEWYDANFTQLSDIMEDNGSPLIAVTEGAWNNTNRTVTKAGAFVGAQTGMVAYISGTNIPTGRYELTDVTDDVITLAGLSAYGDNTDTVVNVGGAFDTLQNALDSTFATSYDCNIFINKNIEHTATLDVDTGGGNTLKNTFKRIIGFTTVPGDMDYGGQYYKSAFTLLREGEPWYDNFVLLNSDAGAFSIIKINGQDNIVFKNLAIMSTDQASGHHCVEAANSPTFIRFEHCYFDIAYQAISTGIKGIVLDDCLIGDDCSYPPVSIDNGGTIINTIVHTKSTFSCVGATNPITVLNSLFIGGGKGVNLTHVDGVSTIANCVFYNQSLYALWIRQGAAVAAYNNIYMPATGGVGEYITNEGGTVLYSDYNCYIDTGGQPLANPTKTDYSGGTAPFVGVHSLQTDPLFVDAADGDFRPRNGGVLKGGRADPVGNPASMGVVCRPAWKAKGRQVNLARLAILR